MSPPLPPPPMLPPPPPPLSERVGRYMFIIACVAWAIFQVHGVGPEAVAPTAPRASTTLAPEMVDIEAQTLSRVDLAFDPRKPIGPDNPWVARQKHAPCMPDLMVEIFSLCWFQHGGPLGTARVRCPAGTMTYEGKCYFPVTRGPREGVSNPLDMTPILDGGISR